jgi:hypothetical protein
MEFILQDVDFLQMKFIAYFNKLAGFSLHIRHLNGMH